MHTMNEGKVIRALQRYLHGHGLITVKKLNLFDHAHDAAERTFITDLAAHPLATKGPRTHLQEQDDARRFDNSRALLDHIARELADICIFPSETDRQSGWCRSENPNPMAGLAFEIENAKSKYFLGSLLAASIAGRWGILIVPDTTHTRLWVNTVRRMIHKGGTSPIPSNTIIVKWPDLDDHIRRSGEPSARPYVSPAAGSPAGQP